MDIDQWLVDAQAVSLDRTHELVSEISRNRNWVFRMLEQSADPEIFPRIHARFHSLGFYSIVLTTHNQKDLPSLRINIYLSNQFKQSPDAIHNHAYDFSSTIVVGSMRQILFKISAGPESYHKMDFNGFQETRRADICLRQRMSVDMPQGSVYSIDSSTIHSVIPTESRTITALVRTAYERRNTSRYCPLGNLFPEAEQEVASYEQHRAIVRQLQVPTIILS